MIFGMTHEERIAKSNTWQKQFALIPEKMNDGRYVWMQNFYKREARMSIGDRYDCVATLEEAQAIDDAFNKKFGIIHPW